MNMHYYNAGLLCFLTANSVISGVSIGIFLGLGLYWMVMAIFSILKSNQPTDK